MVELFQSKDELNSSFLALILFPSSGLLNRPMHKLLVIMKNLDATIASLEKYIATGLDGAPLSGVMEIKCYPNPINDEVQIEIQTPNEEKINVVIMDNLGRTIRTLYNESSNGKKILIWNETNCQSQNLSSGI